MHLSTSSSNNLNWVANQVNNACPGPICQQKKPSNSTLYADDDTESFDEADVINHSIKGNRLYQRPDGSIGIVETSPGFIIGEKVLAPTINLVCSLTKNIFNAIGYGIEQVGTGLSNIYNFQILPGAAAQKLDPIFPFSSEEEDLTEALDKCTHLIETTRSGDTLVLAELYYQQGLIFKKLGMYQESLVSFNSARKLNSDHNSVREETDYIESFTHNPKDLSHREKFLEDIGFDLPNHHEYLLMSALAYESFKSDNIFPKELSSFEFEKHIKPYAEHLASKGWKVGAVAEGSSVGYMGVAFVNTKTKRLIVAHKGTHISSPDDLTNCLHIFQTEKPQQYEIAKRFTDSLSQPYQGYEISHAGHSLGAVLAELSAYERREAAVTADSPGILGMISQQYAKEQHNVPIVSYLTIPNFINTYNAHMGTQRALQIRKKTNAVDVIDFSWSWLKSKVWDDSDGVNQWVNLGIGLAGAGKIIAQDLESHKILGILEGLDASNGQIPYRFVKKWPQGIHQRMSFDKLCKENCSPSNPEPTDSQQKYELSQIYQTEPTSYSRIKIEEFTVEARDLLINLRSREFIPANLSPRLLSLYYIEGDEVCTKSDNNLFTAQDFHRYIEQKIAKNKKDKIPSVDNPFYACCKLQGTHLKGKNKDAEDAYLLFFSLQTIKECSEISKNKLKVFIAQDEQENLEAYLKFTLGDDFEDTIKKELDDIKDEHIRERNPDFGSLLHHLFSSKSHLNFLAVMHQPAEFFIGKILTIRSKGIPLFSQEITHFKLDCRKMNFLLEDGNRVVVHLKDNCKVNSVTSFMQLERPLLYYLSDQSIGAEFELKLAKDSHVPEWMQGGNYRILESKKEGLKEHVTIGRIDSEIKYAFHITYSKDRNIEKVSVQSENEQVFNELYQMQEFFKAAYISEMFTPLTNTDPDDVIAFQENFKDEYQEALEKIDILKQKLVETILQDNQFLELAIEHFIKNKIISMTNTKFKPILKELVTQAQKIDPKTTLSIKDFLQEGVLEANYQKFVRFTGEDSVYISEAMRLFTQSDKYSQEMRGKDLILIMGNTGSGKGTTISAFQECKLKKDFNRAGQKVYVLNPEKQEGCAKIGHSLSSSETLYAQGYPVKDQENLVLADTPGLGENRGKHFVLCAALSIDEALKNAKSIKSLVITIPLQNFLLDRGNGIIDLMKDINQLLPDKLINSDSIYILITKHNNYGNRKLNNLIKELLQNEESEDRKLIWGLLWKKLQKGQMEIVPIDAAYPMKQLLEKYSSSKGIHPSQITTLMQTDNIKRQFANHIQAAASTWHRDIFQRTIKSYQDEVDNNKKIHDYKIEKQNVQDQVKSIKDAIANFKLGTSNVILKETAYQTCLKSIEVFVNNKNTKENEINSLNARIDQIKIRMWDLIKLIEDHSTDTWTEIFHTYKPNPNEILYSCIRKKGSLEAAHFEGRAMDKNDCINGEYDIANSAADREGSYSHTIQINRDYYLVPTDRAQQEVFEQQGVVRAGNRLYRADIIGEHYELDLTRRVHPNGKMIVYYFTTHWKKGRALPWLEVKHEIPKVVYHSVSIAEWSNEKNDLQIEKKTKTQTVERLKNEVEEWNTLIQKQKGKCQEDLLSFLRTQQKQFETDVQRLENNENNIIQENAQLVKERKMVAVIIKTRWTTAKSLKSFTQLVVNREIERERTSSIGLKEDLIATCKSYQEIFNTYQKEFLPSCKEDLGVACDIEDSQDPTKKKIQNEDL